MYFLNLVVKGLSKAHVEEVKDICLAYPLRNWLGLSAFCFSQNWWRLLFCKAFRSLTIDKEYLQPLQGSIAEPEMISNVIMECASRPDYDVTGISTALINQTKKTASVCLQTFFVPLGSASCQVNFVMDGGTARMVRTKTDVVWSEDSLVQPNIHRKIKTGTTPMNKKRWLSNSKGSTAWLLSPLVDILILFVNFIEVHEVVHSSPTSGLNIGHLKLLYGKLAVTKTSGKLGPNHYRNGAWD